MRSWLPDPVASETAVRREIDPVEDVCNLFKSCRAMRPGCQTEPMLIQRWDQANDAAECHAFLEHQGFGHLIAAGRDRSVPVVVPTQYTLDDGAIVLHLATLNPIWDAIAENPLVVLSVAGDWAYIPSHWKVIGDEDPLMGIPTTYYAAAQVTARATVLVEHDAIAEILRLQLRDQQPDVDIAEPLAHGKRLAAIRALRLEIEEIRAKFKYGGNVDVEHRISIAERLAERDGPGDRAAREHLVRRLRHQTP